MRRDQELPEEEYSKVEMERPTHNSYEESIEKVQQQSEFHNPWHSVLRPQRLVMCRHAGGGDHSRCQSRQLGEARVMETLNQMLAAKTRP